MSWMRPLFLQHCMMNNGDPNNNNGDPSDNNVDPNSNNGDPNKNNGDPSNNNGDPMPFIHQRQQQLVDTNTLRLVWPCPSSKNLRIHSLYQGVLWKPLLLKKPNCPVFPAHPVHTTKIKRPQKKSWTNCPNY